VAGWGWTSTTGDKTSVLMEVDLKVLSGKVCENFFQKKYLHQSMICAGDEEGKKSTFLVSVVLGSKLGMRLGLGSRIGSQVGDKGD